MEYTCIFKYKEENKSYLHNLHSYIRKCKIEDKIKELEADLSSNPNYGWLKRTELNSQIKILKELLEEE